MTTAGIDRLQRACAQCQDAADGDVRWLGEAIARMLKGRAAGEMVSLDRELGLEHWRLIGYRNDQIRAARRCLPTPKISVAATEISRLEARVRSSATFKGASPELEEARKLIASALHTGLDFPKKRQLINILRSS